LINWTLSVCNQCTKLFVAEYVKVMHPVRTALDVLQGDKVVGLGYLVPMLTVVKNRLKECSPISMSHSLLSVIC